MAAGNREHGREGRATLLEPARCSIRGAELLWNGKYDESGRLRLPDAPSLRAPSVVTEQYGDGAKPNRLLFGDNLVAMANLLGEFESRVDMVYIDPPFCVGTAWKHGAALGEGGHRSSPARDDVRVDSYDDRWGPGGENYLQMMFERLVLVHRLLSETGVAYVHVDWRAHPFLRLMLEEIFGPENLVNEIVWSYRSGGGTKRKFGSKHDNILLFAKSSKYKFNADAVRVPYDAVIPDKWRDKFHARGKVCPDVWDISRPPNHSYEWIGYATQKPEALIERAILASTDPGDLVADFFCGSGTTGAVAHRLGRRWIMSDQSPAALNASRRRLVAGGVPFVVERPAALASAPPPFEMLRQGSELRISNYQHGMEAIDFLAVDATDQLDSIFRPHWFDYRMPKKRQMSFVAPVMDNRLFSRVLLADIYSREWFMVLENDWLRAG